MKAKKVLSAFLTFCLIFGCTVFSFATYDNDTQYLDYGTLEEGRNLIWESDNAYDSIDDLYVSFSIIVPSDGYYLLKYGTPHTNMYAEIIDNFNFNETIYDDYLIQRIYYLEKGNYDLNVDIYSTNVEVMVYWEYLGENVTDITYDYDLIYDCDFWCSDELYVENFFMTFADATITFSSGKEYNWEDGILSGTMDSDYSEGSNNITIDFLGKNIATTANIYPLSNYIKDIEISNIENYYDECKLYFNGADFVYPYGETITVTFADSSTESFEYNNSNPIKIELANGGCYEIFVDASYDPFYIDESNQNCFFDIYVGFSNVKTYQFEGNKASLAENISLLKYELNYCLSEISYNMSQVFFDFINGYWDFYLTDLIDSISELFGILSSFIAYVL